MINRRSTPSGEGRGRGRAGGSGRGGRPAFRSDDSRGGRRDDFRGGSHRDGERGGPRRDDTRGDARRDDFRASRRGERGGFRDDRGGRDDRAGSRGGGGFQDRSGSRSGGGYQDRAGSRGGGFQDRAGSRGGGFRDGSRGGDSRGRDDRAGYQGDRRAGAPSGRGDRDRFRDGEGFRGDRRGSRDERGGSRDERGGFRDDRGGFRSEGRDESARDGLRADRGGSRARYGRPAARDARERTGFGGGDRNEGRDRFESRDRSEGRDRFESRDRAEGRDRFEGRDRYQGGDRYAGRDRYEGREGAGRGSGETRGPREERGGFRADRSGRRDDAARGGSRGRFGRRDDSGRGGRTSGRDGVQTIGGARRDGGRRDGGFGGPGGPGGSGGSGGGRGEGGPARDRFKTARQPMRDRDFFPDGYTDERDTTEVPDGVRLQKVLAQAGVASRRACEEMIGDGRVTVNGQVVRRFGAKVDPATQVIHVDGKRIPTAPDLVYYALNKPIGVVSTMDDPQGRPCLADFVEELAPRLFHVGRLDTETEGLLLLTNDGELANRLTHPSYGVQKKYWAKVPGPIPRDLGRRLKQGIELEDGLARADSFAIVQEHGQQALVEVVLHEGRKHVVRRMLEEAGHRVIDLARIEFGPVKLGRTKPGTVRALSLKEVGELYAAVKL
ncbi:pseudouridine synthase [Nonomuraea ceibae]|uniref:pseudouridine synthase n=1 Tax=Nonomuraea ceibae TaxID=1935170 RepID=UPI0027E174A7|nr:pseudouridine synthase [Nonomuraea ceibae]